MRSAILQVMMSCKTQRYFLPDLQSLVPCCVSYMHLREHLTQQLPKCQSWSVQNIGWHEAC